MISNNLYPGKMSMVYEVEKAGKNGRYKEFNKHAVLIAEGVYVNGQKHGTWREYYDSDGSLMIEEEYWHGIKHGGFKAFHPNGKVMSEGGFSNGSREGLFRVYDEDGNNLRNLLFRNDELINEVEIKPIQR
jgi:antitoxin component YwqK of YwqJK toxin-antitoxin module